MREPVWASGLAEVKRKRENLKRETCWASGLAVVDLAALSWVAALGWKVDASRMVAGHQTWWRTQMRKWALVRRAGKRSVGTPLEMLESRE